MSAYRLYTVIPRLLSFVDSLSRWYLRFQKDRLKGDDGAEACESSLVVLFEVLYNLCILMAPITPFFVDFMYLNLRFALPENERQGSVHFVMLPEANESKKDDEVLYTIECLQSVMELGRKARDKLTFNNRIPMPYVTVCHRDAKFLDAVRSVEPLVLSQLRVRELRLSSEFDNLVTFEAAPDRRALGKQLLGNMKAAMAHIMKMTQAQLLALERDGSMTLTLNGTECTIDAKDIKLLCNCSCDSKEVYPVTEQGCLLMMAKNPDDSCLEEGLAREFVSRVQRLRKDSNLRVEDAVSVHYTVDPVAAPKLSACLSNLSAFVLENLRVHNVQAGEPSINAVVQAHLTDEALCGEPVTIWIVLAKPDELCKQ
jgi:isoleucyl-tRNA synthetase